MSRGVRSRLPWLLALVVLSVVAVLVVPRLTTRSTGAAIHPQPVPSRVLPPLLHPPKGLHWRMPPASPHLAVATADHGATSWLWMDPQYLRFRFLPGYTRPEGGPRTRADHNPATWVPAMVAAFNGGYKLSDHVGGYYYLGHTVSPLRRGYASMVFYRDGTMRVGVWGWNVHMTPDVVAVRQNMKPLVWRGVSQTHATDTQSTWGFNMVHGWWIANRSALGMRADGSLVFVYGHHLTPSQMAQRLIRAGVRTAIALDMNGWWPTGFLYSHYRSHIVGAKINSFIQRSPSVYLDTYSSDFVAVLGTGA